jgi:surfeit locus 1 family protein
MGLTRNGVIVFVAALSGAAATARLGFWQRDRADQKVHLQEALQRQRALPALPVEALARDTATAALQTHRLVVLEGHWRAERTVHLDNRQMNDRPGFYALTPLMLDDGSAVLVQRGWFPRDPADRTHLVAAPPPAGRVRVEGRIALDAPRLFEFSAAASGPIRQNLSVAGYATETALALRPLIVVQEDSRLTVADGLLRQWPAPAADVAKHYGYAFQWFALSTLFIGLYAWFQLIRPSRHRG